MTENINPTYLVPVCFVNDCHEKEERNSNNNKCTLIPFSILPPLPQNIHNNNNNTNTCDLNNTWDRWTLKNLFSNSPQSVKSKESVQLSKPQTNNIKCKNKTVKKAGVPFYERSPIYNKNNGYNNNNNNNRDNQIFARNHKNNRYYTNNANGHYHESKDATSFHIFRKVRGLTERFTSKAKLFHIATSPPQNYKTSDCNALNQSIWDLYCLHVQKEETYLRKLEFWKTIYLSLQKVFVKYGLFMVGSTMCGFATENSDIDMCLLVKPCLNDARSDSLSYLQNIQRVLQGCDFLKSTELILAKVPILKLKSAEYGFEVDLNCNNAVGIRNTHLMNCYAQLDWRVRPLVIIVKLWAQANNINDAKNKTISSYSLVLMVIHFLQCGVLPPVIPCLHGLYPEKFNPFTEVHIMDIQEELPKFYSDNKESLGALFIGFLRYYTFFDFDYFAISVREGSVLSKEECRYNRSQKNTVTQWKLLCIEEPFDFTNTAKSVYDIETFEYIKNVFLISYKALTGTKNLDSIIPNMNFTKETTSQTKNVN